MDIKQDDERVCREDARLESFEADWPHDNKCSKQNMAQAGLYYIGPPDYVKCFVCHIKVGGWDSETDEPWKRHQEMSPHCIFAKLGLEQTLLTVEQWIEIMCCRAINKVDTIAREFVKSTNMNDQQSVTM